MIFYRLHLELLQVVLDYFTCYLDGFYSLEVPFTGYIFYNFAFFTGYIFCSFAFFTDYIIFYMLNDAAFTDLLVV